MSKWIKEDAVDLDLPSEEIIHALCFEIEEKDALIRESEEKVKDLRVKLSAQGKLIRDLYKRLSV